MSVLIYKDPKNVGVCAATMIAAEMLRDPRCVIGVDYHETLLPAYESLSLMTDSGLLVWNEVQVYQLFEFLPKEDGEAVVDHKNFEVPAALLTQRIQTGTDALFGIVDGNDKTDHPHAPILSGWPGAAYPESSFS